jgi:hypothetical protein
MAVREQQWIFSCGHMLTSSVIIPNTEYTVAIPGRGRNAAATPEKHSPDKCPECAATEREAEKNKTKPAKITKQPWLLSKPTLSFSNLK